MQVPLQSGIWSLVSQPVVVFAADNKAVQSSLASIVLMAALLLHVTTRPFESKGLNNLETAFPKGKGSLLMCLSDSHNYYVGDIFLHQLVLLLCTIILL